MKGLSEEIELSITNALVGMELNVDVKLTMINYLH
jgi:hypothetical protein